MKSHRQRQDEQLIREFVGPLGQTDPMAPGGAQAQAPPAQAAPEPAPADDLPSQMQQFLKRISSKSPQQIVQIQQQMNAAFQKLLAGKGTGAARRGVWSQYTQSRDAKQNFGQPGRTV